MINFFFLQTIPTENILKKEEKKSHREEHYFTLLVSKVPKNLSKIGSPEKETYPSDTSFVTWQPRIHLSLGCALNSGKRLLASLINNICICTKYFF